MAQLTVFIGTASQATYSGTPPVVKPGDSVLFILQNRTDTVTVEFDSGSPFSQKTFVLAGANTFTAQQTKTVVAGASGTYRFQAVPGLLPGQPGTVSGDIDVTPPQSPLP
ncbi:hypothetical protein [Cystobacter ferrugineus]|uniref:EfeO-type cupredoxin-like domain-containing protein n=1 Tax=Cystobacter ferrugineus TaxID=83449 RepID=A0A1L9BJA8_9BACT|nr:hypothetical protein [Cystobacter ferrugineus]OJH42337.1 hypothetical protein BON30_03800 [Cystobacter ferrugineus]